MNPESNKPAATPGAISGEGVSGAHLSILFGSTMAYVGVALPFFPVFLAGRGLSDGEIAAVLSVSLLMRLVGNPVVTAIADGPAGLARTLAACAAGAALLSGLLPVAAGLWQMLSVVALLALVQGPMMPLADAIALAEIRRRQESSAPPLDYGRLRVWGSGTVFAVMLGGGAVLDQLPQGGVAALLVIAALAPVAPALALVRRSPAVVRAMPAGPADGSRRIDALPLVLLVASAGLVQASHAAYYAFASLHWTALGLSRGFVGSAWALGVGCEIVFFVIAGRVFGGERNAVRFLWVGAMAAVLRWAAMTGDPSPTVLLALQAMHALTFAATHLGAVHVLAAVAGPARRAQVQGWLAASVSCGLAMATAGTGQIYAVLGEQIYWIMAAMAAAGLAGVALVSSALRPER